MSYKGECSNSFDTNDSVGFYAGCGEDEFPPLGPVKPPRNFGAVGDPIKKGMNTCEEICEDTDMEIAESNSKEKHSVKKNSDKDKSSRKTYSNERSNVAGQNKIQEGEKHALKQAAKVPNAWRASKNSITFFNNRVPSEDQRLKFIAPNANKLIITDDMISHEWDHTLIGYFMGRFPGFNALKELCKGWGVQHEIKTHESGWLIFKFKNEEEVYKVLNGGPYSIWGRNLMIKKMPYGFHFDDTEISCMPVWIKLRNLPLCCWNNSVLQALASFIGKPLYTDKMTQSKERVSYARLLVEVDAALPLVREVTLQLQKAEWVQPVEYEFVPMYCLQCRKLGHTTGCCPPIETWEERRDKYLKKEEDRRRKYEEGKGRFDEDGFIRVGGKKEAVKIVKGNNKTEVWKEKNSLSTTKTENNRGNRFDTLMEVEDEVSNAGIIEEGAISAEGKKEEVQKDLESAKMEVCDGNNNTLSKEGSYNDLLEDEQKDCSNNDIVLIDKTENQELGKLGNTLEEEHMLDLVKEDTIEKTEFMKNAPCDENQEVPNEDINGCDSEEDLMTGSKIKNLDIRKIDKEYLKRRLEGKIKYKTLKERRKLAKREKKKRSNDAWSEEKLSC